MAQKKQLSKEEGAKLKSLFAQYDAANQEEEKAQKVIEKSGKVKSATCKALMDEFGAGPYIRGGQPHTIVKREFKNKETGAVTSTTFYFRGPKDAEGIEVPS